MAELAPTRKTKRGAQKSRAVYGKQKTDAPKVPLERESNRQKQPTSCTSSQTMRNIDTLLDSVQQKIEKISIYEDAVKTSDATAGSNRNVTKCSREVSIQTSSPKIQRMAEVRVINSRTPKQDIHTEAPRAEKKQRDGGKYNQPEERNQESYFIEDKRTLSYVQPILNEAMSSICRQGVQRFDKWAERAGDTFTVKKIAEGSYGEVYQLCIKSDVSRGTLSKSRLARLKAYRDGVFKIVPLRAQRGVGSKKFTSIQEIVAESQLLKLLDPIPGFARFREVHVVQGRYPTLYQAAWDEYSETMDDCFNPDPSKKKSYPDTQLWAILEMENAGSELEKYKFSSIYQMYDVFWGVAMALARAEQFASFEHRDLHLGNVCVKTRSHARSSDAQSGHASFKGSSASFGISGLETTIIDYSLSRADLDLQQDGSDLLDTAWSNLDSKQLFDAIGRDEEEKLLRDTYRLMRAEVYNDDDLSSQPRQTTSDERWKSYNPKTNLVWLSFILTMLLRTCQSGNILPPKRQPLASISANQTATQSPKKNKQSLQTRKLDKASDEVADHWNPELEYELYERLQTVQDLLEFDDEYENLMSAGDLVATAIGYQWLADSDFLC